MSVKGNLIAAKNLIENPEKWVKGDLFVGECFCAIGAIGEASCWYDDAFTIPETEALRKALPSEFQKGSFYDVADFNDHPDTTHADIMSLFDRAISACEE